MQELKELNTLIKESLKLDDDALNKLEGLSNQAMYDLERSRSGLI